MNWITCYDFWHGIYRYIPETDHVLGNIILHLLCGYYIRYMNVTDVLYFHISTCWSMCAVASMAVFCSSLISCFPGMFLRYFLNYFYMVPVAPIITGITFFLFSTCPVFLLLRFLYFKVSLASFLITFLFTKIAKSINIRALFSLSRMIISGLLIGMVLLASTCRVHHIVTLTSRLASY